MNCTPVFLGVVGAWLRICHVYQPFLLCRAMHRIIRNCQTDTKSRPLTETGFFSLYKEGLAERERVCVWFVSLIA